MTNPVGAHRKLNLITPDNQLPEVRQEDFFFRLLMFFHIPAAWSVGRVALFLTFWAGLVYAVWSQVQPVLAFPVSAALFLFSLTDWLLLRWLPGAGRSFGPINPQLTIMLIPRLLVAMVAALLAYYGHPAWGLIGFWGLELTGSLVYVWGLAYEPMRVCLSELVIDSPHISPTDEPIRLLHLSDFHIERLTRRESQILQLIDQTEPDLIVITGDYLNASYSRDPKAMAQVRYLLSQLKAPHGVYAVLGTPSVDIPEIAVKHFQGTDVQLLRQDVAEVDLGDGRHLSLLGLDCTHDPDYDANLLNKLIALTPQDTPRIFLYHSPELMPAAQKHDLDLYLCGHTHGGQVRLPGFGAFFTSAATGKKYEMGRYDENGTTLYVSRGIGFEGLSMPRLRLFCPPEITLVTLK